MAVDPGLRLATLTPTFADRATSHAFEDWLDAADPDAVVLRSGTGGRARRLLARHAAATIPVIDPGTAGSGPRPVTLRDGDRPIVLAPDARLFPDAIDEPDGRLGSQDPAVVVTRALDLEVDTTALSTTLHGRDALEATAERAGDRSVVVLSTGLPDGYRNRLAGTLVVRGIGEPEDSEASGLPVVEVRPDGAVLSESVDPARLGLRALASVGTIRAGALRDAGYQTRRAVAATSRADLEDISGFGPEVAKTVHRSAKALVEGRVVRRTRTPLPTAEPLFVDIETDGLHPTVTFLIGVLEGGPDGGTYRSFLNRDPADPGQAIEAFVEWYATEGNGRPLVAYNGRRFDFRVLTDHLRAYRPGLLPDLERADTVDPYAWAVRDGNAVLPGRTNRLEDVAGALGHNRAPTGLTGAAVARRYRRWLDAPTPDREPDWDRIDAYCEDDLRALARVYEALADASEGVAVGESAVSRRETTTQGTLGDW